MNHRSILRGWSAAAGGESVKRREALVLAAIVVVAFLLRTFHLLSLPIFNDEAVYLRWAADILDQKTFMSLFIPVAEDGKQPLFIWLAAAAMTIFPDPLMAGRMVSAFAGIASVIGIWLAGRTLMDRKSGLIAATLYAITPYTVLFDRMALADSLVSMTAIWSLAIGAFMAKNGTNRLAHVSSGLALGTVMAFGVWVKPTALFALPIPILCFLLLSSDRRLGGRTLGSLAIAFGLFAFAALLLFVIPYAEKQLVLLATHVYSPEQLSSSLPTLNWESSSLAYMRWIQAYLPMPVYWISVAGAIWGLICRRRVTLILVGSWLGIVVPSVIMAHFFSSRYVLNSVFPLLLLSASFLQAVWSWISPLVRKPGESWARSALPVLVLLVGFTATGLSSVLSDLSLIADPLHAEWPDRDRDEYVDGWPAGAGFAEALEFALAKTKEYNGQEVFIMSDHFQGFPHDALALYVRNIPGVRHYVEAEIAWGGRGIYEKWRSHNARMLIVRDDGRRKPETFEKNLPEAKLLGTFWKPGGRSSFRVYELDIHADQTVAR